MQTYNRMQETLKLAIDQGERGHVYLGAGSLTDWRDEDERFIEIACAVQQVNRHQIPMACGSGALLLEAMQQLHADQLVDNVCFNLETWSKTLSYFDKLNLEYRDICLDQALQIWDGFMCQRYACMQM